MWKLRAQGSTPIGTLAKCTGHYELGPGVGCQRKGCESCLPFTGASRQLMAAALECPVLVLIYSWRTYCSMKTVVLVDAGSGYSRCSLYSGAVPLAVPDSASKLPGNALARVIRDNQDLEFLEGLMEVIKEMNLDSASGGVDVFIGATAGVRSALDDGTVRPCEIDRFTETVKKFFRHPFHGRFEVISGEQEALMEMVSVEHAVNALGLVEAGSPLGLISSGGMSSQVVFTQQTTGDLKALSIATSLKVRRARWLFSRLDARWACPFHGPCSLFLTLASLVPSSHSPTSRAWLWALEQARATTLSSWPRSRSRRASLASRLEASSSS